MKALLIDDHPLILSGLSTVIQGFGDDVSVACIDSARGAREMLAVDAEYDLVLLDLHLGDCCGFELLEELRTTYPSLPIVVVSSSDSNDDVTRSIYLGAMGFIPKRASNEVLFDALSMVMSGGIYVPPMVLRSQAANAAARRTTRAEASERTPSRPSTPPIRAARRPPSGSRHARPTCWSCCCGASPTSSSRGR